MNFNIKYIACAMALTASLSSCNDWLDVEPSTELDASTQFATASGTADALAGIYINMTSNNLYGKNLTWYMLELAGGSGISMFGDNSDIQSFCFHPEASSYDVSTRNALVDKIWSEGYNTIANVNSMIAQIEKHKGAYDATDYNVFLGEAIGLRAFLHFDLLRLFGPAGTVEPDAKSIPYVSVLAAGVSPMLTVKECADKILADLNTAKDLLKSDPMYLGTTPSQYLASAPTGNATYRKMYGIASWHNRRFHFNYYAAVATMARVYQWMGDKKQALACAREIIDAQQDRFPWVNSTLVANVAGNDQNKSKDRTFSTEQIFALNIIDMEDRMDGYMIEREKSFQGADGNILGFDASFFDADTRTADPRWQYLRATFSYYGTEFQLSVKYYKDNDYQNSYSPWSANRLPLIRLSEMYYIAAECEPNLATATAYLETVRQHRGMSAYPLEVTNADELQHEIFKEYCKEFIAEGQLFFYRKRMNETYYTKSAYEQKEITPNLLTFPHPDDEDTYGGRN